MLSILSNDGEQNYDNAFRILNDVRKKYIYKVVIGHLNINSLANKFDGLTLIIKDKLDILVLVETKLDDRYTETSFSLRVIRNLIG